MVKFTLLFKDTAIKENLMTPIFFIGSMKPCKAMANQKPPAICLRLSWTIVLRNLM